MGDMGPAFGMLAEPLMDLFGVLAKRALRAFAASTLGITILATLVAVGCFFIANAESVLRGALAAGVALVLFAVVGGVVALKRAIAEAVIHGCEALGLGTRATKLLFTKILHVDANEALGDRGVAVAMQVERLPLDRAEAKLRAAVDAVLREGQKDGFLRRKLRTTAIDQVSKITLARFREEGQAHGGVDLVKVRDELAATIDRKLLDTIRAAELKVTVGILGGATLVAVFVAWTVKHTH